MSKTNQTKTRGYREKSNGYQRGRGRKLNCMEKDGNKIFGGEHTVVYTEVKI